MYFSEYCSVRRPARHIRRTYILWLGIRDWSGTTAIFEMIDRLLFVLMLIEILHTVRIFIRSHMLVVETFLIVGLIARIRRMLVLTLQAEGLTKNVRWIQGGKEVFEASMVELLVLALISSPWFSRSAQCARPDQRVRRRH